MIDFGYGAFAPGRGLRRHPPPARCRHRFESPVPQRDIFVDKRIVEFMARMHCQAVVQVARNNNVRF